MGAPFSGFALVWLQESLSPSAPLLFSLLVSENLPRANKHRKGWTQGPVATWKSLAGTTSCETAICRCGLQGHAHWPKQSFCPPVAPGRVMGSLWETETDNKAGPLRLPEPHPQRAPLPGWRRALCAAGWCQSSQGCRFRTFYVILTSPLKTSFLSQALWPCCRRLGQKGPKFKTSLDDLVRPSAT